MSLRPGLQVVLAFSTLVRCSAIIDRLEYKRKSMSAEDKEELARAYDDALNVIMDRIFIAAEMSEMDLGSRWVKLTKEYKDKDDD